ncbi:DUF1707 and DUF2154 domain-containing protein [Thermobifida halotolerans]|uniref:DUF1707 and DUF2154 domain-containing protein n=1 Tax=Thermobifida halotolerans TaxID=483545 RepID=A0A399G0L4_9ACTN|nr:DUF1707 domain-containing protein [Thermobifida halotolerans]UOE18127.1 DUF1707 and DUF2154 domain-containing protein [Thermobifida halotolerans]
MSDSSLPDRSEMRASDADRDRVAARLREALAEGRLTPDEHSERLDAVYSSKTLGELAPLVRDLPDAPESAAGVADLPFDSPRPVYGRERVVDTAPDGYFSLALMGAAERSGHWTVSRTYQALAVMGGVELDLREARFVSRETTIVANALMGAVEIIVPDDIEVRVNGVGVMGAYEVKGGAPSSVVEPGTPVVRVVGAALMGAVEVVRKPRKHQKRRKELEEDDD